MPVLIDKRGVFGFGESRREMMRLGGPRADCIDIGLVNNMPDAALDATERQFVELLGAASQGFVVRLRFFSLPPQPTRNDRGLRHLATYAPIEDLDDARLDALIVTGSEPRASDLRAEPYWRALAHVVDWAEANTISSLWSCLAAHAVVLHRDGIERTRLARKCSGVFACDAREPHALTATIPQPLWVPHSRTNDLDADALTASGNDR